MGSPVDPKQLTPKARKAYYANKIQSLLVQGLAVRAIAEKIGIPKATIYKLRREELGLKALPRGIPPAGGHPNPYNPPNLKDWVIQQNIILDGEPFSFTRHEYLEEPYSIDHPFVISEKAAQMGLTSWAMLVMIWRAKFRMTAYRGILYLFPSRWDVSEFSKGRVTPLIEENPVIGEGVKDTDSVNLKRIWNTLLYFRGMKSRISLKSTPADFIIFDELDEAPMKNIDMAMKRMSHSQFKEVIMLSNPTLPDYGINKMFQKSDQRYWLLKCPKCNQYTCMEDTFPDCIDLLHGKPVRLCMSCRDSELNPSVGQWVAKKPIFEEKRGYHFSQLFSHFVTPTELYDEFRSTTNPREFFNLSIGVPYIEAQNRLTIRDVLDLCSDEGIVERDPGPCSMGVDQGKGLHVVIGRKHDGKRGKIIHLGVYKEWEELYKLMDRFNVTRCVVDAQPEMRNARKFADKFQRQVYLNFYRETQKGKYKWDDKEFMVTCNRTESLDNSHHEILMGQIILPSENLDIVKEFAEHLHAVAKNIEDELDKDGNKTGNKRAVYVRLGDDHFRHAFNYECMARQFSENLLCEWAQ